MKLFKHSISKIFRVFLIANFIVLCVVIWTFAGKMVISNQTGEDFTLRYRLAPEIAKQRRFVFVKHGVIKNGERVQLKENTEDIRRIFFTIDGKPDSYGLNLTQARAHQEQDAYVTIQKGGKPSWRFVSTRAKAAIPSEQEITKITFSTDRFTLLQHAKPFKVPERPGLVRRKRIRKLPVFKQLKEWTKKVFSNLPEFSMQGMPKDFLKYFRNSVFTTLEFKELNQTLERFINQCVEELAKKELWLKESCPNFESAREEETTYVQKITIGSNSKLCLIGDIHGSVHSFLRILLELVVLGYIDENFKIKDKNFFIILLGDLSDRGCYSIETFYTAIWLKLINWNNVIFCKGNHENSDQNMAANGLFYELTVKFHEGDQLQQLLTSIEKIYKFLPVASFIECGKESKNYIYCSHGGIHEDYNPSNLLNNKDGRKFEFIGTLVGGGGFAWSDFVQGQGKEKEEIKKGCRGMPEAIVANYAYTNQFMKDFTIKAIVSGHQDLLVGCKMLFKEDVKLKMFKQKITEFFIKRHFEEELEHFINKPFMEYKLPKNFYDFLLKEEYPDGPFYWKYVVPEKYWEEEFKIEDFFPLFIFSSSPQGRGFEENIFPFDCFGILQLKGSYPEWYLKIYERLLNPDRHGKFVTVKKIKEGEIETSWSEKPASEPLKNFD